MHQTNRILFAASLGVSAAALSLTACGSGSKPKKRGCAMLVEQLKDCSAGLSLKGEDTDERVATCKKRLADKDPVVTAALRCAKRQRCGAFETCMKSVQKLQQKQRQAKRLRKQFAHAKQRLSVGNHNAPKYFCRYEEGQTPEMKAWCKNLPKAIYTTMTAKLIKARDTEKITWKETTACDKLLGYAIKLGKKQGDAAGRLCQELTAAKELQSIRKSVAQIIVMTNPYHTFPCRLSSIKEKTQVGTPFAQKVRKQMIALCYGKLGKRILALKVPKQKHFCWVGRLYKAFKELNLPDPEIKRLMAQAAKKCEKK